MAKIIGDYTPPPISKAWTPEERLAVVAKVAEQLRRHPETGLDRELFDIQERLRFLATAPASFLEANRQEILNDQE